MEIAKAKMEAVKRSLERGLISICECEHMMDSVISDYVYRNCQDDPTILGNNTLKLRRYKWKTMLAITKSREV